MYPALLAFFGEKQVLKFGATPDARRWAQFGAAAALLSGVLFCAAGIVCFFAWNWAALPALYKFLLLGGLMLVMVGLAGYLGPDSPAGGAALLLAAIIPGPFLAVFGQTYQSGAPSWELFRAWAPAALLCAFASRRAGLWFLAWLVCSAWAETYLSTLRWVDYARFPFMETAQALCIVAWEAVARCFGRKPALQWLAAFWVPRLMACAYGAKLTFAMVEFLTGTVRPLAGVALYIAALSVGWWWYRFKRPDLFMLCMGLLSLCVTAFSGLWNFFGILSHNAMDLLGIGIVALLFCLIAVGIIRHWLRAFADLRLPEFSFKPATEPAAASVAQPDASVAKPADTKDIGQSVRAASDAAAEQIPAVPWYARFVPALGAWASALLFCSALLPFVFSQDAFSLGVCGVILLFAARLLFLKGGNIYCEQLALALGLTGTAASSWAGLQLADVADLDLNMFLRLLLLWLAAVYALLPQRAFRLLTACAALPVFALAAESFGQNLHAFFQTGRSTLIGPVFAFYCIALAYGRRRFFRTPALQPLVQALFVLLPLVLLADTEWASLFGSRRPYLEPVITGISLGSGLGLMLAAWLMSREARLACRVVLVCAAGLATGAGWYLPVLPLALLGLSLARYKGSRAEVGFTAAWLSVYMVLYYYNLATSLLYKSLSLSGVGLLLLGAAFVLHRSAADNLAAAAPLPCSAASPALWRRVLPLVVCLCFLGGSAAAGLQNEQILREGRVVYLELRPRDPREFLLGDYMELSYSINRYIGAALQKREGPPASTVVVQPDAKGVSGFVRLDDGSPLQDGEQRLRLRLRPRYDAAAVAPQRFYFQEGTAREYERKARYGELRVAPDGSALLVRLLDEDLQPITPIAPQP